MQIKCEDRRVYIAGDGKEFLTHAEAVEYEMKRALNEIFQKATNVDRSKLTWPQVRDFLIENAREIIMALDPFYGEE